MVVKRVRRLRLCIVAQVITILLFLAAISSCAVIRTESPARIGLLAPFEGRYREIGYNALYAARLALAEAGRTDVELLAVDDGGTIRHAADRARALTHDPTIRCVIVLGYNAADPQVQQSFGDLPIIIVGNWLVEPQTETAFILSSPHLKSQLSTTTRLDITQAAQIASPLTGSDILALEGFRALRSDFHGITLLSTGTLPSESFRDRILASDPFAVAPNLLATSVYDAVNLALIAIADTFANREAVAARLTHIDYQGMNGHIQFQDGFWSNAPIHAYTFSADGQLTLESD